MSAGSPTEEFGPYLVYEQLGIGGMAKVHRAVSLVGDANQPVALKRMLSHISSNEEMVKSFVREARLASYLRHQNVAQTYDLGRVGEIYFIVMELITGRNLREVLRHCGATTGPMPVPVALNILNQICDALDYAHNLCDEHGQPLGIIHRDVSPSNIIVSDTGVVKLIDFGIAKASGGGMQTMGGTLKGKFAYMAPEYIAGRIDARADLFAIGVIAHELLTNRPLFAGRDDIDTLTRVRDMHLDPPSKKNPQVPPEIDDVVMTALARDPDRRWQHATALRTAMTTLTQRLGLVATNAQVIQWLDWAFTHKPAPRKKSRDADTAPDAGPPEDTGEEPSIAIEQATAQLITEPRRPTAAQAVPLSSDAKPTLMMDGGAYVPTPKQPITEGLRTSGLASRGTSKLASTDIATVPSLPRAASVARSSSSMGSASPSSPPPMSEPPRAHSPSSPPPNGQPRAHSASVAPPLAQHPRAHSASVAPPLAQHPRAHSASVAPPLGRPMSGSGAQPAVTLPGTGRAAVPAPISHSGSGPLARPAATIMSSSVPIPSLANRPARPSSPPPMLDQARSAAVQREFAQRMSQSSAIAAPAPTAAARSGRWLGVLLVLLAAAVAAISVYFVLPLLT